MKTLRIFGWILAGLAAAAALGLAFGVLVMLLWNWLAPTLFGLPEVTYWQAVGLFVLCHILFKGPSAQPPSKSRGKKRERSLTDDLKDRFPGPDGARESN